MWWWMACVPGEGPLGVNEVASRGADEAGGVADWLEVLNDDDEPRSLAGWTLAGPDGDWPFPDEELAAGALVVVWCGGEPEQGSWHAPFDLPDEAFELLVTDDAGDEVQRIQVPATEAGQSFGRVPDDAPNWQVIDRPSPGARNGDG